MRSQRKTHIVLCNAPPLRDLRLPRGNKPLRLDYQDQSLVRLRLPDFVKSVGHIPPRVLDLLELAGYVFAADRLTSRGDRRSVLYDSWSRVFRFIVKVRDIDFWSSPSTKHELSELLQFISGDREYSFEFVPGHATGQTHLFDSEEFRVTPGRPHTVVLFSGGLDSLAGAVDCLHNSTDVICLVSHRSGQPSTTMTQDALIKALEQRYPGRIRPYRFSTGLTDTRAVSETQRTRTFLYGSIAFGLASALNQTSVRFFENGITSLNFPRRQDLLNARASRTTHPRTLFLLQEFLSSLAEKPVQVTNGYRWKTKTDVLNQLKIHRAAFLIPSSVTCSRTPMTRGDHTHCGTCFQCIDRRFAAQVSGLSNVDHPGLYTADVLSEAIPDGEARTSIIDYIRLGLMFADQTPDSFYDTWITEISDAMTPLDREEAFVQQLFDLTKRFGNEIKQALQEFAQTIPVAARPVAGSLLEVIHRRDYLLPESERFASAIGAKLQRAVPPMFANQRPLNENDFNDKINGLLAGDAEGYRREFPATQFAMARVIPDHALTQYGLLVESKYIRAGTAISKITDQIAADLIKYPTSSYVVFAIYDPDRTIRDDTTFTADIKSKRNCAVVILR